MIKNDRSYCCVPQCKSLASRSPFISFHRFPKFKSTAEELRRKEWIRILRIGKEVSNRSVVCAKHFTDEDYRKPGPCANRKFLKRTAVPSLNIPQYPSEVQQKLKEQKALKKNAQFKKVKHDPRKEILFEETADDTNGNKKSENMTLTENVACTEMKYSEVSGELSKDVMFLKNSELLSVNNKYSEATYDEISSIVIKEENTNIVYLESCKSQGESAESSVEKTTEISNKLEDFVDLNCKKEFLLDDFRIEHMEDPRLAKEFFRLYQVKKKELDRREHSSKKKIMHLEKAVQDLEKLFRLCEKLNAD